MKIKDMCGVCTRWLANLFEISRIPSCQIQMSKTISPWYDLHDIRAYANFLSFQSEYLSWLWFQHFTMENDFMSTYFMLLHFKLVPLNMQNQ